MEVVPGFNDIQTQNTHKKHLEEVCSKMSLPILSSLVSTVSEGTMPQSPMMEESKDEQHLQDQYNGRIYRRSLKRGNVSNCSISRILLSLGVLLYYGSNNSKRKSNNNNQHSAGFGMVVMGFPTGAGGCQGDTAAVMEAHLDPSKNIEKGELDFGGIVFSINGIDVIKGNPVLDFPLGQDMEVTVIATFPDVLFRGVLIRMEVPNSYTGDTTTLIIPSSPEIKVADVCIAPVRGITHTNRGDKEAVSGTINVPLEAIGTIFDVTVVFANDATSSAYVYSRLIANFRNSTTSAPTAPSTSVVTIAPTLSGTLVNATEAPSVAVVGTRFPTTAPVVGVPISTTLPISTTTAPVLVPSDTFDPTISAVPTSSFLPTATPIVGGTKPTSTPTFTPTVSSDFPTITMLPTITGIPTIIPISVDSDQPSIIPTPEPNEMMMMMMGKGKGKSMKMMGSMKKKGSKKGMESKKMMMKMKSEKGKGKSMMEKTGKGMMKGKKDDKYGKGMGKKKYYNNDNDDDSDYDDDEYKNSRLATTYDNDDGEYNDDYAIATTHDDDYYQIVKSDDDYYNNVGPNQYKESNQYISSSTIRSSNMMVTMMIMGGAKKMDKKGMTPKSSTKKVVAPRPMLGNNTTGTPAPGMMRMRPMMMTTTKPVPSTVTTTTTPATTKATSSILASSTISRPRIIPVGAKKQPPTNAPTRDIIINTKPVSNIFQRTVTNSRVQQ